MLNCCQAETGAPGVLEWEKKINKTLPELEEEATS